MLKRSSRIVEQIWLGAGAACVRDGQVVDIHWVSENFRDERN
jgi:hypothetical protein